MHFSANFEQKCYEQNSRKSVEPKLLKRQFSTVIFSERIFNLVIFVLERAKSLDSQFALGSSGPKCWYGDFKALIWAHFQNAKGGPAKPLFRKHF